MSGFLYSVLGLIIITFELLRKRVIFFDAIFFASVFYFIFFVLSPLLLLVNPEWQSEISTSNLFDPDLKAVYVPALCLVGYLMLITGWWFGDKMTARPFMVRVHSRGERKLLLVGFSLGALSFALFVQSFGGLIPAILQGSGVRYGRIEHEFGATGVFRYFIGCLTLILVYLWSKKLSGDRLSQMDKVIGICAAPLVAMEMLIDSSRGAVVNLVIALAVIATYSNSARRYPISTLLPKKNMIYPLFLLPGVIVFVIYGKQIFWAMPSLFTGGFSSFAAEFASLNSIRIPDEVNFFRDVFVKESDHAIASIVAAIKSSEELLWFRDLYLMPLHLVPSSLLGIPLEVPPTVSVVNTVAHVGIEVASIPPGIIGMLLYNGGVLAVPLGLFLYGVVGSVIQKRFFITSPSPGRNMIMFYFAFLFGAFVTNGDVKVYLYSQFPLLGLILILLISPVLRKSLRRSVMRS